MPTILLIAELIALVLILKIAYSWGYKDGQRSAFVGKLEEFSKHLEKNINEVTDTLLNSADEAIKHDTPVPAKKRPVKKS